MLEPKRKRQFGLRDKPDKRGDPFGALRLETGSGQDDKFRKY